MERPIQVNGEPRLPIAGAMQIYAESINGTATAKERCASYGARGAAQRMSAVRSLAVADSANGKAIQVNAEPRLPIAGAMQIYAESINGAATARERSAT
jgi:hypothetical protein